MAASSGMNREIEKKAQLNDNNLYLKDITGQCETKAKEWDQRSKARARLRLDS